jgi:GAF domain-containing protein
VVARRRPLVIQDAREMSLTASNLAVQALGVVAYLGVPLEDPEGHVLGALCIIDRGPRQWDAKSVELLQDLSRIAMDAIVLEMTRQRQAEAEAAARAAEDRFRAIAATA